MAAIRFQPLDRLPFSFFQGSAELMARLSGRPDYAAHPKDVALEAMRNADVDFVLQFVLPDRRDQQCGPSTEVALHDGLTTVLHGLLRDWVEKHGQVRTPEDLRDFCLAVPPVREAARFVDAAKVAQRWLELDRWGACLQPAVWIPGHLCGTVGWMWYTSVGYENWLMAHALYPEALDRFFSFAGEEGRLRNAAIARCIREHDLTPIVYSGEDICGNDGPLCSPQTLHEVYFPHLQRALAPLVDSGIVWLWHSDGLILPILDDLLACGITGFQGFEEDKGMNMGRLAATPTRDGTLPILCGSVNVTTTFYESPSAVRASVARMQRLATERGGGVMLASSSSIMADTPVENILAFIEAAREKEKV